jgi:hypothetical protein
MRWRTSSFRRVGRTRLITGRGRSNTNKPTRKYSAEEIRAHEQRLRDAGLLPRAAASERI